MKKIGISVLVTVIMLLMFVGVSLPKQTSNVEYLRIHIRANSNEDIDQSVKYKVKDRIVEYLTPFIAECKTKSDAEKVVKGRLSDIEKIADDVLLSNGFEYTSDAKINNEKFPTRVYEDFTLSCGYYDALIINLGSGSGDNWWCVVYPPLCFTKSCSDYEYRSKIFEVIQNFKNKIKENK